MQPEITPEAPTDNTITTLKHEEKEQQQQKQQQHETKNRLTPVPPNMAIAVWIALVSGEQKTTVGGGERPSIDCRALRTNACPLGDRLNRTEQSPKEPFTMHCRWWVVPEPNATTHVNLKTARGDNSS